MPEFREIALAAGDEIVFAASGACHVRYEVDPPAVAVGRIRDAIKHRETLIEELRSRVRELEGRELALEEMLDDARREEAGV